MTNANKLHYLEGIRGIAALIVLIGHLKNTFAVNLETQNLIFLSNLTNSNIIGTIISSYINIFFDGALAVYIFWFMSGYVISIKLFKEGENDYLTMAFIKRYFRLAIPVLGSVIIAYLLLKLGLMHNIELSKKLGEQYYNGWLGSFYNFDANFIKAVISGLWNTFFTFDLKSSYNASLWSMNPELYGSFFIFFLFGIFKTTENRHLFYIIIISIAFLLGNYWLITFITGFLLCDINNTDNRFKKIFATLDHYVFSKWYYSLLIFNILIVIGGQKDFFGITNVLLSGFIVFVVMRSTHLKSIFEHKIIRWLGKISFSVYLIHIPIICSLTCFLYLAMGFTHTYNAIIASATTIVFVLLSATIYTKTVDDFSINFSNRLAKKIIKQ